MYAYSKKNKGYKRTTSNATDRKSVKPSGTNPYKWMNSSLLSAIPSAPLYWKPSNYY